MSHNFHIKYLYSGTKLKDLPISSTPEFALVGKSNVGKSSLINFLAGQKRLAYISQTPGRTQAFNIFSEMNDKFLIADLPGYGFSKTSKAITGQWEKNIREYFEKRKNICAIFLLIDIRRDITEVDKQLIAWFDHLGLKVICIQTKCDKVSKSEIPLRRQKLAQSLFLNSNEIIPISVHKKIGLENLCNQFTNLAKLS